MNSPDSIATSSPSLEKSLLLSLLVVDSSREARPAAHFPLLLLLSHRHLFLTQPPPAPPPKTQEKGAKFDYYIAISWHDDHCAFLHLSTLCAKRAAAGGGGWSA